MKLAVLILVVRLLWPALLPAQIYRYQDDQGLWHFTDEPQDRYETSIVPDITTSLGTSADHDAREDLATRLQDAYAPVTPIAYATLAVVSIKAEEVEGSGFFCSDEGHILTNRHVVRPESEQGRDKPTQALAQQAAELRAMHERIKDARRQLGLLKRDLNGYEELIKKAPDDETLAWAQGAQARMRARFLSERERIAALESSTRTRENELRGAKQEQGYRRSLTSTQRRFTIVLKDGSELTATLLEVASDQDLALLKLNGYRTPFLGLDPWRPPSQGLRVFAIGNPLGVQDAVTAGVITQVTPEHLLTDAQILPGSSGGPLVRETGEVIGINVSRKVAAGTPEYAAGLGKVIPIGLALKEFPVLATASRDHAFDPNRFSYPGPDWTGDFGPQGTGDGPRREGTSAGIGGPGFRTPGGMGADTGRPTPLDTGNITTDPGRIRLIVPDEDEAPDVEGTGSREPRSLDFPPEGSGNLPPGFSIPRE